MLLRQDNLTIHAVRQHVNLLVQYKELIPENSTEIDKMPKLVQFEAEIWS